MSKKNVLVWSKEKRDWIFQIEERVCAFCGSHGHKKWSVISGKFYVCNKCYSKHFVNPKSLQFKEQRLMLDKCPRKHICTDCGNQIGDEYINYDGKRVKTKRTAIHHEDYDESDPLAHTVELCASCHAKREWTPERKAAYSQRIRELWRNGAYANRK